MFSKCSKELKNKIKEQFKNIKENAFFDYEDDYDSYNSYDSLDYDVYGNYKYEDDDDINEKK